MIRFYLLLVSMLFGIKGMAQSLPANTCGVVYSYDAAGNRIQRKYMCNNSARTTNTAQNSTADTTAAANQANKIEQVTALYPNPTTGRFTIAFTQALQNAVVSIVDMNGRMIQQLQKSGTMIEIDLSGVAPGMYLLNIKDNGNTLTQKVIKQ